MKRILVHPSNVHLLKTQRLPLADPNVFTGRPDSFAGMPVYISEFVPEFSGKWIFPDDPPWIYEPSDEIWCRYFGIGQGERVVWVVNEDYFNFRGLGHLPGAGGRKTPGNLTIAERFRGQG